MALRDWSASGALRRHVTSAREIQDLIRVVERDLKDATIPTVSTDRRFATAYNAALQLATIVLHAGGFRTSGAAHHWVTIRALPEILGPSARNRADFLDVCRSKRNSADYDRAGGITEQEVEDLLLEVREFHQDVVSWLRAHHPRLSRS